MNEKEFGKIVGQEWANALYPNLKISYFNLLGNFLEKERKTKTIYPPKEDIFNSFLLTPYDKVNVIMIGYDPYINENQACGVAFGITDACIKVPFSLQAIYKEVEDDVYNGLNLGFDYSLKSWCNQGCFLYNTALTVEKRKTGSHLLQWKEFTKTVFKTLNEKDFLIYILLGRTAQSYAKYIEDKPNFHIIRAAHPAAESYFGNSAGFYGSKIFSKINEILKNNGRKEITW
jgi:uracil-DNA glycosylase